MMKLKKFLCLILALLLMYSCASASSSSVFVKLPDNDSADMYLRIFVPGAGASDRLGHYDLMIRGTVYFRGRVYTDPCFSYNANSKLYVFDQSDTLSVYTDNEFTPEMGDCSVYYWHFTGGSSEKIASFLKYLNGVVSSSRSNDNCSKALTCTFKSSCMFSKYRTGSVNCFFAVAYWMLGLGDSTLSTIYRNAYNGKDSILPEVLVQNYGHDMTKVY